MKKSRPKPRKSAEAKTSLAPAPAAPPAEGPLVRVHVPNDAKRFVRAVFARKNPLEVAGNLLDGGGSATSARFFTLLLEYLYGKPLPRLDENAGGQPVVFEYISRVPRPPSELARQAAASQATPQDEPETLMDEPMQDPMDDPTEES